MVAVLPLEDVALSTSGDYERYFEQDGTRYHHVIDPATGRSAGGVRCVTVVAPDGHVPSRHACYRFTAKLRDTVKP